MKLPNPVPMDSQHPGQREDFASILEMARAAVQLSQRI
jgi:hypothetical protein